MVTRRRYLGLFGGTVFAGSIATSRILQSAAESKAFSRLWGDPGGNSYANSSRTPNTDIELSWQRSFESRPEPIVGQDGRLFVLFDNGKILSLDTSGRSFEMSLINRMPGAIDGAMLQGTRLLVTDEQNTMAAFDTIDGDRIWQRTHTDGIGEPVYANGSLYYPTAAPSVLRVNPEDGSDITELEIPSRVRQRNVRRPPQLITDAHERDTAPYVYGSIPASSGGLFAYNTDTQSREWAKRIENNHLRSIVSGGSLYTASDSTIYRLDPRTGQVEWQQRPEMRGGQVAFVTGDAVVVWSEEKILAVTPGDGSSVWESGLRAPYSRAVIGGNDTVYVLKRANPVVVIGLDLATGLERWRYPFCDSGELESPALTDEYLLVGHHRTIYAFSNESEPMRRTPTESESTKTPGNPDTQTVQ